MRRIKSDRLHFLTAVCTTLKNEILTRKLFGFVKCKLVTPQNLWPKFEEMPPIFVNREVPEEAVLLKQHRAEAHSWKKAAGGL